MDVGTDGGVTKRPEKKDGVTDPNSPQLGGQPNGTGAKPGCSC